MQVGWKDPSNGHEESFEYWLARAEEDGHALGYPYEILAGMAKQLQGKDRPKGFSATMLAKCARAVFIDGTVEHYAFPADNYAAFRGVMAHSMLELAQHPGAVVERRVWRMFEGEPLSGQLDKFHIRVPGFTAADEQALTTAWLDWCDAMYMWEQATAIFGADDFAEDLPKNAPQPPAEPRVPDGAVFEVDDWKSKVKVPFGIYVYGHHQQQGNVYRWLTRLDPDRARIQFVYVSMDEVKTLPLYDGGKFANGRQQPAQVLNDEAVEDVLRDRLGTLVKQRDRQRPLPYDKVPVGDLWECNYCPVRELCYSGAAEEARTAFEAGKSYLRITPRNAKDEEKVKLPGKKKKESA